MYKQKLQCDISANITGVIEIQDENHNVLQEIPMHSLLHNFLSLFRYGSVLENLAAPDTGTWAILNNAGTGVPATNYLDLNTSYIHSGISIGTGTTTKSFNMYSLGAIATTSSFTFTARTITGAIVDDSQTLSITKKFYNNTAGTIKITQLGLTRAIMLQHTTYCHMM